MVFGIDLGTTNSLIGNGEHLYSNLVSSNVDVVTGKQVARDYISRDVVASYKTNMSMGTDGEIPIKCSTVILKELANIASRRSGEDVKDVVISVPAYFSTSQREAVCQAANLAGLNVCSLLNEPTAAALYVCRNIKDLIVVFDLGGGTFDISIVDSRLGNYKVVATDGLVKGGDDLDKAIVHRVLKDLKVPVRFQTDHNKRILKVAARKAKEEIQKSGSDVYISLVDIGLEKDFILTVDIYKELVREVFDETIELTLNVIGQNIPASESLKVVFVGGSSNCPYLKEMVKKEIDLEEVTCDINPDLIVAKGVSLYAKMYEEGTAQAYVEDVTKRLCIAEENGGSITVIEQNSIIPCKASITVNNPKPCSKLSLDLYQGSAHYARDNDYIGTLVYDYGKQMDANEGVVEVGVEVSTDGIISLKAFEVLYGEAFAVEVKLSRGEV